jgi:hypothetical protein
MTLQQKLHRRELLARRCFEAAGLAFRSGARMKHVTPLVNRYSKAAKLVDLTAQKAIEERTRG